MKKQDKVVDRIKYLWDELSDEEKERKLSKVRRKLKRGKVIEPGNLPTPQGSYKPEVSSSDMAAELEEVDGLRLDDGWLRLVCLHKWETLCFQIRERYEAKWVGCYSKVVKSMEAGTEWPFKYKPNPWRFPAIFHTQIMRMEWHEEHEQYKVEFTFGPGVTQTFWFFPNFKDSGVGEGWVTPRRISKFTPFPR
jgi:hypothetical protein